MAVMQLAFTSQYLHINTQVAVVFPEERQGRGQSCRTLWLLPGRRCDHTWWLRQTGVERYAVRQETVVIMPGVGNSDYVNWDSFSTGLEAETFFLQELMPLMQSWLPISRNRAQNAIAGPTEAALRLALACPERFALACQIGGLPMDYEALLSHWEPLRLLEPGQEASCRAWREAAEPEDLRLLNLVDNVGGRDAFLSSDGNLRQRLLERTADRALPLLCFQAGTLKKEDRVYLKQLTRKGIAVEFQELAAAKDVWEQREQGVRILLERTGKEQGVWR